jgi:EmrB/QacA subfamily drug resistance transporter
LNSDRALRYTLAATTLGSTLAFIDGSVVNVALPALARGLHADPSTLPWAINAYLLSLGALILLGGGLGDHFGRRRLFLVGLLMFTAASILCALAPDLVWLLAGRGIQGMGAALLMPNSLAILGGAFSGEERGRAVGTWAGVGAVAGALGPIVGGWFIDAVGWRVIFLINVPLACAAGYLTWKFVAEQKESAKAPHLDVLGSVLATAALGLLTWSLTDASGSHRVSLSGWIVLSGGVALAGTFLAHERRLADRALVPLSLFASTTFLGLTLLTFFLYAGLGGLMVLLPFLLIQMHHWSAVAAGAALLPIPVLVGMGSRLMGRIGGRFGGRLPIFIGSSIVGLGLALYARLGTNAVDYLIDVFPPTLLVGLGLGVAVAPLTTSVMAAVDTDHVGIASGFNNAVARIGGLVATALLGLVIARQDSLSAFILGFRVAAFVGAVSALLAAMFAITLIRNHGEGVTAISVPRKSQ